MNGSPHSIAVDLPSICRFHTSPKRQCVTLLTSKNHLLVFRAWMLAVSSVGGCSLDSVWIVGAQFLRASHALYEVTEDAFAEERWQMSLLMAGKQSHEMLGDGEFELRQHTMKLGARTLEAAMNERRQEGVPG